MTINQLATFIYNNRNNITKEFSDNFYNSSGVDIAFSSEMHILTALYNSEIERFVRHAYKNYKIVRQTKK